MITLDFPKSFHFKIVQFFFLILELYLRSYGSLLTNILYIKNDKLIKYTAIPKCYFPIEKSAIQVSRTNLQPEVFASFEWNAYVSFLNKFINFQHFFIQS